MLRYFGDRLGTLLSSALPLMFLFGGRGNIFIPLTGWSYRTFNIFHRWIARIFLIEVVLHGAIFSAYDVNCKRQIPKIKRQTGCGVADLWATVSGWGEYHAKLQSDEVYRYGIFVSSLPQGREVMTVFSAGTDMEITRWALPLACRLRLHKVKFESTFTSFSRPLMSS